MQPVPFLFNFDVRRMKFGCVGREHCNTATGPPASYVVNREINVGKAESLYEIGDL